MRNIYEVKGEVTLLILLLSDRKTEIEALIDTDDLEKASQIKNSWCLTNTGYVNCKEGGRTIPLHRFLLGEPKGLVVDHINHNTLDNRKINLRAIPKQGNDQNRSGAQRNNKSGFRNVYWSRDKNKWHVSVGIDRKKKHIGYFDDIEEAKKAATEARSKLMKYAN